MQMKFVKVNERLSDVIKLSARHAKHQMKNAVSLVIMTTLAIHVNDKERECLL